MMLRLLIGYLWLNNTQGNISQLYNYLNIISNTINSLNPDQMPVDTADQPIIALTKELMIRFPDKFGPDKYCYLFGSLHLEKSLLIICDQVIKGTELDKIMCTCSLSIAGADSIVTVNYIKRARYCLQVGPCVIYSKLNKAHMDWSEDLILLWLANKSKINEIRFYWNLIPELMIDLLFFIRSCLEGKYVPYITSLCKFIHWYFALDHYNYAR